MKLHKLKTFVDPSNVALENAFNEWAATLGNKIEVIETSLTYSAALQKFIVAVVYKEV